MTILSDLSHDAAALTARLASHAVAIRSGGGRASGLAWRENLVVAPEEAVEGDEATATLPDGTEAPARVVGRDPSTDVALLRVDAALPAPVALDGAPGAAGAIAFAVARGPDGPVAAMGLLASVGPAWRSLRGGSIDARLRLDLRLSVEGALVAGADGRPYGMAVAGPRRSVLVIPAATIERVAPQLLERGRVARGYLGLGLQPVRVEGAGALVVVSVDPDGPGARAGLMQGDILRHVGGEPVGSMRALAARLGPDSVGETVELALLRGGAPVAVTVVVAERPDA